jgi:membrane-bound metal-dependent hydrolase YbcI (DUF457 family)
VLPNVLRWRETTQKQVTIGAVLGAYSHLVFDSVMHSDIRPLSPFSQSNGLLHYVSLSELHLFCVAAGVVGLIVLAVREAMKKTERF